MTRYVIEEGVPLPPRRRRGRPMGPLTATLIQMRPGQSVPLPDMTQDQIGARLVRAARATGHHFVSRSEGGGTRIFCVAREG